MSDEGSKKWKCAWCGKPQERNDPPCDNCGHHKFERAVVPTAPADPDHEPEPVWVCPECGREHQKNSPPCSRCGNPSLEKRTPDYSDLDELSVPSYLDLVEPIHVAGALVAVLAGGLLVLGVLGIGPLAGLVGQSLTVADVPGDAETASGLSLAGVEAGYVDEIRSYRADRGVSNLTRTEQLDDVARFLNQRRVKGTYTNESVPPLDRAEDPLRGACDRTPRIEWSTADSSTLGEFDAARTAGRSLFEQTPGEDPTADGTTVGVDVHLAPDGRVFVTRIIC